MFKEYSRRKKFRKISNNFKKLQSELLENELDFELYSDLYSVETRDIYTTARLQLLSVELLLNFSEDFCRKNKILNNEKTDFFNDYCLDIGGNIGFYTRYFSKRFSQVVSLEPNPRTFEILKWNTIKLKNVLELNVGASSQSCIQILRGNRKHSGGFSLSKSKSRDSTNKFSDNSQQEFEVQVLTGPDLYAHIKKIDKRDFKNIDPTFIKIDVESHELDVLKGLNLENFQTLPVILLENNQPEDMRQNIVNYLKKIGYANFFTTSNLLAYSEKNRTSLLRTLYRIGGIRLIIKSLNKNTVVELTDPHRYKLEQLLALSA